MLMLGDLWSGRKEMEKNRIKAKNFTIITELPFNISFPLCWNFFICSIMSTTFGLSTSTSLNAVIFTLLYLKSSKSNVSISY